MKGGNLTGENLPSDFHRRVLNSLIRERAGIQAVCAGLAHFSTVFLTDSKVTDVVNKYTSKLSQLTLLAGPGIETVLTVPVSPACFW